MLARLANVIYWSCSGLAVLLGVGAVVAFANAGHGGYIVAAILAIMASMAFGVGRAVRYVVLGK
jgi:hypothetical protein